MTKAAQSFCVAIILIRRIKDEGKGKCFMAKTFSNRVSVDEVVNIFDSCYSWEFVDGRPGIKMKSSFVNTITIGASLSAKL